MSLFCSWTVYTVKECCCSKFPTVSLNQYRRKNDKRGEIRTILWSLIGASPSDYNRSILKLHTPKIDVQAAVDCSKITYMFGGVGGFLAVYCVFKYVYYTFTIMHSCVSVCVLYFHVIVNNCNFIGRLQLVIYNHDLSSKVGCKQIDQMNFS